MHTRARARARTHAQMHAQMHAHLDVRLDVCAERAQHVSHAADGAAQHALRAVGVGVHDVDELEDLQSNALYARRCAVAGLRVNGASLPRGRRPGQ
jgi:hypothetical protein